MYSCFMNSHRIDDIRKLLDSESADALLVWNHEESGQPGTRYVCGFSGTESVLCVAKDKMFLIVDGRYVARARQECPGVELYPRVDGALVNLCKERDIRSILFDSERTSHAQTAAFGQELPDFTPRPQANLLQKIRMIKDDREIDCLRQAAQIAAKAFEQLLSEIRPGVSEHQLASRLECLMRNGGAEKTSFDTIVAAGLNGAIPHHKTSDRALASGELVTFDFGCVYEGYASDITRTVALGEVPQKLRSIYQVVEEAQARGTGAARAGLTGQELDAVCRSYITERGYGEYFVHTTGHGIGMEAHELPNVTPRNTNPLPVHTAVSIEPGVYIDGLGGVRIEDIVVLRDGGCENVTQDLMHDLLVLPG